MKPETDETILTSSSTNCDEQRLSNQRTRKETDELLRRILASFDAKENNINAVQAATADEQSEMNAQKQNEMHIRHRESALLLRERDLLQKENELLRRENDMLRASSQNSTSSRSSMASFSSVNTTNTNANQGRILLTLRNIGDLI